MKKLVLIFFGILVILTQSSAFAQNTGAQEKKKARLENEIAIINRQLKENQGKSNAALSNLNLIKKKIQTRNALIAESDKDIAGISEKIRQKEKETSILQSRLDTLTEYYGRLVRNSYKNRDGRIWYMYILSSENLGMAFRRIGYLRGLSRQMNRQAEKILQTKEELSVEMEKLQELKAEAEKIRSNRMAEVDKLHKEEKESANAVKQLKANSAKYQKELSTKKKQVAALNREIERIIREATGGTSSKKGGKTSTKPKTEIDYTLAAEFEKNKGKLPWPVDGAVVESYGQHYHPVYKNVKLPFHNGISIAVDKGTEVKAVFDGVVKQIVVMAGYGQCVLVQHGSYFSFYCRLGSVSVKAGEKIKTGQKIGAVDRIGNETMLEFQIWKGSTPQNPSGWLR